jgi:cytochrome oxidase assembly protein ShyY1
MHLPDDHMRYAIIWFSLAGLLLIAFAPATLPTRAYIP